jgi:hypothetical protein
MVDKHHEVLSRRTQHTNSLFVRICVICGICGLNGSALDYIDTKDGVSNLWRMPINGGQPKKLTNWNSDLLFWFAWAPGGKQLATARGSFATDLVLLENLDLESV